MNSVKGEFVNLSEELTDDAVSIEDIDEVLQTLERATSSETEIEEPLIEESSSVVESEEGMNEEVELDLSAGEMDKTSDPIRVHARDGCCAVADARAGSVDREAHRARSEAR